MKYYAIPKDTTKHYTLTADSYNEIVDLAKNAINRDITIGEYEIVSVISKVSISMKVECFNVNYIEEEGKYKFDHKPPYLPEPPEDYIYFGRRPIYSEPRQNSRNIAMWCGSSWELGNFGSDLGAHYAVRVETKQFDDALKAYEMGYTEYYHDLK